MDTGTNLKNFRIYWKWPCPPEQDPVFPTASASHQEASTSLLSSSIRGHNHRKLTKLITSITVLSNSMKLWAMQCRATQDRWIMMESSDKWWSTGEGNVKPLQHSCLENPMNSMKRQKDMTLKDEFPRSLGAQYATGEEWRNSSKRNEEAEPKQKQCPGVDVSGGESKVQFCKEQYCIETWNVQSMNQGKLEVVKQEMARMNTDILGISELKWTVLCEFNSNELWC